jgi:RecB family exonuclease
MAKPFAWSFSALGRYETCPKQYYHINVKKDVKDEYGDSEAGAEGNAIHQALFKRVTKGDPLPLAFRQFESTAARFAAAAGDKSGELKLALDREFRPTDFFASDVYIRAIIDLLIVRGSHAIVIDWKTGKVKPDFTQLALSAAVLSQYAPEIETFDIAFVWLKHKNVSQERYTKHDFKKIWADLIPRATRVEMAIKTSDFPLKPSGLCGYCPVRQCPEWKERER